MTDDEIEAGAKKLLTAMTRTWKCEDDLDELAVRLEHSILQNLLCVGGEIHTMQDPKIRAKFGTIAKRNRERMSTEIPGEIIHLRKFVPQLPEPLRTDVLTFLIRLLSDVEAASVSVIAFSQFQQEPSEILKLMSGRFMPIYEQAVVPAKRLADRIQAHRILQGPEWSKLARSKADWASRLDNIVVRTLEKNFELRRLDGPDGTSHKWFIRTDKLTEHQRRQIEAR